MFKVYLISITFLELILLPSSLLVEATLCTLDISGNGRDHASSVMTKYVNVITPNQTKVAVEPFQKHSTN
jgi:hypothetical protein